MDKLQATCGSFDGRDSWFIAIVSNKEIIQTSGLQTAYVDIMWKHSGLVTRKRLSEVMNETGRFTNPGLSCLF